MTEPNRPLDNNTQYIQPKHLWYVGTGLVAACLAPMLLLPSPFDLIPFVLLGGGLFVYTSLRRPYVGLVVYLFVFFFRPYEVFPVPIPYERIIALIVIGVLAIHVALNRGQLKYSRLDWAVTIMVGAAALSVPSFTYLGDNTKSFEAFFEFFKIFLVYFFTLQIVNSKSKLEAIIWIFVLSNLVMAATVTFNYHTGNFRYSMGIARARGYADDGLFSHPNSVANCVVLGLPFLYHLFLHYRSTLLKIFMLAGIGLSAWTVIITGSRGGMLALFTFIMILGWKGKYRGASIGGSLIMILIVVVFMPEQYQNRLFSLFNVFGHDETGAAESAYGRLEGLWAGIRFFFERPLTGVGIGAFARAHYIIDGIESDAHNLLGQILGELGLVGLLAFIWFIRTKITYVKEIIAQYAKQGWPSDINLRTTLAVQTALILMFVQGISGHNLFRYNWYIFACFISIITFLNMQRIKEHPQAVPERPETDDPTIEKAGETPKP